jgi:chitin synthase
MPPTKMNNGGYAQSMAPTASLYGRETTYEPGPRSYSPAPSQMGYGFPPPGYQSGMNTPNGGMAHSPLRTPMMNETSSLYQPTPSRPVTNYLDMQLPSTRSPEDVDFGLGAPTDADLERAVETILRGADLNTVTKRGVRQKLEEQFGTDLTARKATINNAIDRALATAPAS